jgi:outer membrane protein
MRQFVLLLTILPISLLGQTNIKFNLIQCIDFAYKQNFDVKLKELRLKQSENTLEQSEKAIYPNLSGSFSQGINLGRSIDPFTNDFI